MARQKRAPLDAAALLGYALRALAMRAMSTSELRTRLQRRAADGSDIDGVLAKLKDAGFLNDRRFAESYATARLENQGFGKMRVLRDLRQRRVAGEVAEAVVQQTFEGTDEVDLIQQFLARKYKGKDLAAWLSEDKHLVTAFRRLRMAGFSSGASIRELKQYAASADALEETEEDEPPGTL
jgi:regulatory protein